MGFVKVTQRCIGCRSNLDEKTQDGAALCANCKPREAELYLGKLAQLQSTERSALGLGLGVGLRARVRARISLALTLSLTLSLTLT